MFTPTHDSRHQHRQQPFYYPPSYTSEADLLDASHQQQILGTTTINEVPIAMTTGLPAVEEIRGSQYYSSPAQPYHQTEVGGPVETQQCAYSNYVNYESPPVPSYMWSQVVGDQVTNTAWDGVSTDYIYSENQYLEPAPLPPPPAPLQATQQQDSTRGFGIVDRPIHSHESAEVGSQKAFFEARGVETGPQMEVTPVPIMCGGFTQPKIAEYQLDGSMKPPFSYITLIVSAMMSNKEKRATLSEIYAWIMNHFAYYRKNTKRWQNSVRHALSFNDCFTKVPRPPGETGKGAYWTLHEGATGMFENGSSIRRCRKFVDEQRVRPRSGRSRRKKPPEAESNGSISGAVNGSAGSSSDSNSMATSRKDCLLVPSAPPAQVHGVIPNYHQQSHPNHRLTSMQAPPPPSNQQLPHQTHQTLVMMPQMGTLQRKSDHSEIPKGRFMAGM